ncbi:MAG: PIG-L family deacetylase [Actinomycetota bacterium]|nr:PIG-L family deacetylase [Actinomycetota bacterium]MDQ2957794.1 PIG-L family deacetylase [Actinomycetota bacterium]
MSFRLVSFHAHPDDEALLTAGTLARAAAEGHRVTLVVATSGEAGLSDSAPGAALAARRLAELRRSAAALGCARVVELNYPDSGMHNEHRGFAALPVDEPAARLAEILSEERADALTVYDRHGGYGHPDHVQVHRVGHRAAELAGTQVVLQATVDRTALLRALWFLNKAKLAPADFAPERMRAAYTERSAITHRVNVRGYLDQKRASMRAHATQSAGGSDTRTLAYCLKLPRPLYRLAFGTEWFVETGRAGADRTSDDIFDTLR